MKKFVLCISLLSSVFCAVGMAQATDNLLNIAGLEPTTNGTVTYYLKSVGTGLHVSYGAAWGTQCVESQAAHPVVVEANGDGTYAIGTLGGYLDSGDLFMDKAKASSQWRLEKVEGYTNQYYLRGAEGLVLTSVGNSAGILALQRLSEKASQRWIFTNGDDMRDNKMPLATKDCPFDVTVSLRGGAFDYVDGWEANDNTPEVMKNLLKYNKNWGKYNDNAAFDKNDAWCNTSGVRGGTATDYNFCGIINGAEDAVTITYSMNLPQGTYHFSFEGFYEYMQTISVQKQIKSNWYSTSWTNSGDPTVTTVNQTMAATVTFAGQVCNLANNTDNSIYDNGAAVAAIFRDNDTYKHRGTFYLASAQTVNIVISKPTTANSEKTEVTGQGSGLFGSSYDNERNVTTTTNNSQIYIDDFTLLYYGTEKLDEVDDKAVFKSYLNAYAEECKKGLKDAGKAAFDEAFAQIKLDEVGTRTAYYDALTKVDEALEEGIVADKKAEILENPEAGDDFTGFIHNASFENGDYKGWNIPVLSQDTGVKLNSNTNYATEGTDGSYLFNTWWQGVPITQTITGLINGVYRMSVKVASGDINGETGDINDGTVYLLANDHKLGVNPPSGGKTFGDFSIKFEVTDGTATIGVVGGADDDTPENPVGSYVEGGHWWYKCDNFRLEYLADEHLVLEDTHTEAVALDHWYANLTLKRTIKPNTWSTFVVPFDIPANMLEGWEIKVLASSTYNAETGHISLVFEDAEDGIKAGVPYMVRNTTMDSNLDEISMTDVTINTEPKNTSTDYVEFVGTYTKMDIPEGAFFISSNQFWYAKDSSNTTKAFRAYMQPTVANARAMNYRMGGTTSIDDEPIDSEVTVVGIYTLGGVRISEMQEGVNILQMSDGNVVKVVIK